MAGAALSARDAGVPFAGENALFCWDNEVRMLCALIEMRLGATFKMQGVSTLFRFCVRFWVRLGVSLPRRLVRACFLAAQSPLPAVHASAFRRQCRGTSPIRKCPPPRTLQ